MGSLGKLGQLGEMRAGQRFEADPTVATGSPRGAQQKEKERCGGIKKAGESCGKLGKAESRES